MKKRDPKTGKFVRTKPDYKAMYKEVCEKHDALLSRVYELQYKLDWVMKHFPIARWMFNRKFN